MRARYCPLFAALALAGCVSRPAILEQSAYWPFEKIRLQSASVGVLTAYAHRPPQATRAVVILQSPPCGAQMPQPADPMLSTSGILWDELKRDSLLLQLERPGALREESQPDLPDCKPALRARVTTEVWSKAVKEALSAATGKSKLPTVYIGIGKGALPATQLAASDPYAATLLIINGSGLNPGFETLLAALRRPDGSPPQDLLAGAPVAAATSWRNSLRPAAVTTLPKVPTLLVQSTATRDSPLESAVLLLSQQTAAGSDTSMVVVEGLGTDFGLDSGKIECFENVMRLIAQRTREIGQPTPSALTRTFCGSPEPAPPAQDRTEPMRLPPLDADTTKN